MRDAARAESERQPLFLSGPTRRRLASVGGMSNPPPGMRASHEDRDRVVEALRVAGGDGRLSAEELESRVESALTARTIGELARLTADLPAASPAREVLEIRQGGGKYVRDGRWLVPQRIDLRAGLCRVTLDFTRAVITSKVLRIDAEMAHGKLVIVSSPGMVIDTSGLECTYSKVKVRSRDYDADAPLRIELAGTLVHAKLVERRPRR